MSSPSRARPFRFCPGSAVSSELPLQICIENINGAALTVSAGELLWGQNRRATPGDATVHLLAFRPSVYVCPFFLSPNLVHNENSPTWGFPTIITLRVLRLELCNGGQFLSCQRSFCDGCFPSQDPHCSLKGSPGSESVSKGPGIPAGRNPAWPQCK